MRDYNRCWLLLVVFCISCNQNKRYVPAQFKDSLMRHSGTTNWEYSGFQNVESDFPTYLATVYSISCRQPDGNYLNECTGILFAAKDTGNSVFLRFLGVQPAMSQKVIKMSFDDELPVMIGLTPTVFDPMHDKMRVLKLEKPSLLMNKLNTAEKVCIDIKLAEVGEVKFNFITHGFHWRE